MDEVTRFNRNEENFLNSSRIIMRAIRSVEFKTEDTDALRRTCVDCEGELSEIEGFYRAMEAEVNAMLSADKQHNQRKLEGYYGEYLTAVEAFKELRISTQSAAKKNEATTTNRKALVASNERLDQSTYSLQQAKQTVTETEEIGDTIVSDLENQREKLIGAGDNVTETKHNTHTARRALNLISKRVLIQKIFLLILILLLFITIWVLLYYGIINRKS